MAFVTTKASLCLGTLGTRHAAPHFVSTVGAQFWLPENLLPRNDMLMQKWCSSDTVCYWKVTSFTSWIHFFDFTIPPTNPVK